MVLIGKDQQLRWDAAFLQSSEALQALRVRHAEVLLASDYQHRGLPLIDMAYWVPSFVIFGNISIGTAEIPAREPQFLGGVVEAAHVEQAVMLDQALETLWPFARDPIDHISAIACSHGAGIAAIDLAILSDGCGQPFLQILKRFAAPILVDRIGESLPVSGASVEIDRDYGISLARQNARVPAAGPAIAK